MDPSKNYNTLVNRRAFSKVCSIVGMVQFSVLFRGVSKPGECGCKPLRGVTPLSCCPSPLTIPSVMADQCLSHLLLYTTHTRPHTHIRSRVTPLLQIIVLIWLSLVYVPPKLGASQPLCHCLVTQASRTHSGRPALTHRPLGLVVVLHSCQLWKDLFRALQKIPDFV